MIDFVFFEETKKEVKRIPYDTRPCRIAFVTFEPSAQDLAVGELLFGASKRLYYAIAPQVRLNMREVMFYSVCDNQEKEVTFNASYLRGLGVTHLVFIDQQALTHFFKNKTLEDWRGSFWKHEFGEQTFICTATLPSQQVFKDPKQSFVLGKDLARIANCLTDESYFFPSWEKRIIKDYELSIAFIQALPEKVPIAMDIEGGILQDITVVSFCYCKEFSTAVVLENLSVDNKLKVLQALAAKMPKLYSVWHNALYDCFVFQKLYNFRFGPRMFDTLLSSHVLHCELPKTLGFQASIYTGQSYYKADRKSADKQVYYEYNATDSWATFCLFEAHVQAMTEKDKEHLKFLLKLVGPALYLQHKGFQIDTTLRDKMLRECEIEIDRVQKEFNLAVAHITKPLQKKGKKLVELEQYNLSSPKQMTSLLYELLRYPKQYNEKREDGVVTKRVSTDVDALLALCRTHNHPEDDKVIFLLLEYRKFEKSRQFLATPLDKDNFIRCSYTIPGTVTGRFSTSKTLTGTGTNLQTVSENQKVLFLAEPGHYIWNVDLSGADGWTVAAHSKSLGDATMMDDYLAGIKPAKIIALMYMHGESINRLTREELLLRSEEVSEDGPTGWIYFAAKVCQHGTSYGMGPGTMVDNLLKRSYKVTGSPIYVSVNDMRRLQDLFYLRYRGVRLWQNWVKLQISQKQELHTASSFVRRFHGKTDSNAIINEALAQEPQHNTAFATNSALIKLWEDKENRDHNDRLIIKPVHQVHDSLNGMVPKDKVDFLIAKVSQWFDTKLTIAGMELVIPFSGKYGNNWGETLGKFKPVKK